MSLDPRSPTDAADMAPDEPQQDWNGKLYVSNPPPKTGMVWIVTDEGEAHEVAYFECAKLWTGDDTWSRQDGESGSWTQAEILGWSTSRDDAQEAAELLMEQVA